MASKNDISAFKNLPKNKKVVETAVKQAVQEPKATKKTIARAGTMGRPPKPKAEKETVRIAFSITQKEADILTKKAGGLSPSIFVKNHVRDNTDLLK